ncbi:sugar phosphate isomerase/epimerase family protein [Lichenicoccus roseus]|uniref:Sugar phosphate isomerase/epimerase n=1 Tax=Lichenicoccus roseus TaxID=2683649 RepID=A0A5R9J8Q5_9PROT|nr:sugar phosphate isomerase/epimerase family protein [Lichenicoccus roseus]TLU73975.1 sugar phosphate isomerase/epimerase [Lichenicoccus roseus]
MRLAVSNLAWDPALVPDARMLAMLARGGASGVEVAPTRLAPWNEITPSRLQGFRDACRGEGLSVSSLQAIFYGCTGMALLAGDAEFASMREQVRRLAGIATGLGAPVAVFGAPAYRSRGALTLSAATDLASDRLWQLAELAGAGGVVLGLEPVPAVYGADFLERAGEVIGMVSRVGHPGLRVHLDTACVALAGDDPVAAIAAAGPLLAHYHMSEPRLGGFAAPVLDHAAVARALDEAGYTGWVVIEMLAAGAACEDDVATALAFAAAVGGRRSACRS